MVPPLIGVSKHRIPAATKPQGNACRSPPGARIRQF
jgi:hypothetical protein